MKKLLIPGLLVILLTACASDPPEAEIIIQDPLVLLEIAPLPRAVVVAKQVQEYEPVYTVYRIIEVSEVNGVQRFFLVRTGADKTGIEVGVTESIAEDAEFQKIIGKFKIIEMFGDFFRCQIEELDYKIGSTAYIRIKTGERLKEAAASS
ncbi:hypothetical protein [Breznakiella homolactica]|uniref:Lipoprotein n=1 Tax=Breznakiella homolactica TaxID=2798577 RepID=A0A7T8BB96_9SPIR|nr:hypothetical protein [Breznakiella homolactica]QQO09003.1 hypothetical protein JFL75_19050 [Breznakiella homolactica]